MWSGLIVQKNRTLYCSLSCCILNSCMLSICNIDLWRFICNYSQSILQVTKPMQYTVHSIKASTTKFVWFLYDIPVGPVVILGVIVTHRSGPRSCSGFSRSWYWLSWRHLKVQMLRSLKIVYQKLFFFEKNHGLDEVFWINSRNHWIMKVISDSWKGCCILHLEDVANLNSFGGFRALVTWSTVLRSWLLTSKTEINSSSWWRLSRVKLLMAG